MMITTATCSVRASRRRVRHLALTVRYAINRNWSFDAGYHHTEVISDEALFREYLAEPHLRRRDLHLLVAKPRFSVLRLV